MLSPTQERVEQVKEQRRRIESGRLIFMLHIKKKYFLFPMNKICCFLTHTCTDSTLVSQHKLWYFPPLLIITVIPEPRDRGNHYLKTKLLLISRMRKPGKTSINHPPFCFSKRNPSISYLIAKPVELPAEWSYNLLPTGTCFESDRGCY